MQVQGQRVCSAHSTHSRRGPDVQRRLKKTPTQQQKGKAVVFKPPLRFPAPGASPLRKIKQPRVCFISPPAAHHPQGCSSRRAQPDMVAPSLFLGKGGDSAQGRWMLWDQPHWDPLIRGSPHGWSRWVFLPAVHDAAGASAGLCSPSAFLVYLRFDFTLHCQAAFPANCGFCADSLFTPGEDLVDAFYALTEVGANLLLQSAPHYDHLQFC